MYRWLKGRIGTLPRNEGTFLTEADIAEVSRTSRTPVREALLRLQAEGFLQIVPKKGAFVPPISDAEVAAVMQARRLVEDWCVREVARSDRSVLPALRQLLAEQESDLGDPVAFIDIDRALHGTWVRAAGNPVLADFYESLRDRQVRMGLQAISSEHQRSRIVLAEHAAIIDALESGDPDQATAALDAHLASTLAALQLPSTAPWGVSVTRTAGPGR